MHHNLFYAAERRNPWVAYDPILSAPDLQADVRNNLVWDVGGSSTDHGTVVFDGGTANVVNNYYKAITTNSNAVQKRVLIVCQEENAPEDESFCEARGPAAGVYVAGNFSHDEWTDHINTKGTRTTPFSAPSVDTTDACTAADEVLGDAGVYPPDQLDAQYLSAILLAEPCDADHSN